jgi:N4-(beta-N-acetylglucosaminyl)-L-asparaginase
MSSNVSRRDFLRSSITAAALGPTAAALGQSAAPQVTPAGKPIAISSANGLRAVETAVQMMSEGADALDAVIAGVNIVEEDPKDHSVGYGGLPNEDGVVELDSCCMHGPTNLAGAVAGLRGIKTPSKIARLVMRRTDHVLLVGEGALRFAKAHGFKEEQLLTEDARKIWLRWKENHSDRDDWIPPEVPDEGRSDLSPWRDLQYTYGTINCNALDAAGNLSGVTTTSGLSYKIPGRVGDSPIIGAGLFVDNAVGAAGSTGRGEAVIQNCGAHTVIEAMRHGKSPEEACLVALQRISDNNHLARLQRDDGRPNFDVKFYALNKKGQHGGAAIWSGAHYALHDAEGNHRKDAAYLYKRKKP